VIRRYANEEKKVKRLTKSKTAMGRMASSSPSSPQLIDLPNRLVPRPATALSDMPAEPRHVEYSPLDLRVWKLVPEAKRIVAVGANHLHLKHLLTAAACCVMRIAGAVQLHTHNDKRLLRLLNCPMPVQ